MHAHIRVPPDSTGKRVHGRAFIDLNYTGLTGTLYARDTVVFGTSGILGFLSDWTPSSGTAGQMHVILNANSSELTLTPGETLTFSSGGTVVAASGTNFFDNASVISGNTVDSWMEIDSRGSVSTRFAEGSPLMDPYGNLKISHNTLIGQYSFDKSPENDLFSDVVVGTGTITHLPISSSMNLAVTATNGDSATRTSDKYHYYLPGAGTTFILMVALSESSRIGCTREWGAFDANNGMFFCLDSTGALKIVSRGTTSGSLTNVNYNRADWNGDRLDGFGASGFNLDLTKMNTYWSDVQWGVRQRFGIYDSYGARIVCHTLVIANTALQPLMLTATLPIAVSIKNTAGTSGSSSIRLTNAMVLTDGGLDYTYWRYVHDFASVNVTTNNVYCMSVRSVPTISGAHNIVTGYPEFLNVFVALGSIKVDVYWSYMTLTGAPSFVGTNGSSIVKDVAATGATLAGTEYKPASFYLDAGSHNLDLIKYFDRNDMGICARADEATPQYVTIIASKLSGTPTIQGSLGYAEVS